MKKRVLSLLLVMLMVVSLVPMSALAATNGHTANEAIGCNHKLARRSTMTEFMAPSV